MPVHLDMSRKVPVALTIAGSDSGGGAGIQADLKAFSAIGVHGTSAITCITAQNPKQVSGIQPCSPRIISAQIQAVFDEMPPMAVKTGMLYSARIIQVVADSLHSKLRVPIVVDPVMVATSGARLLKPEAIKTLIASLLPLSTLITPNLQEAEVLVARQLCEIEDLRRAAKEIQERFGSATLIKGGHLRGTAEAVDILNDGGQEWLFSASFIRGRHTHGTGCTYSAAITAYLALGHRLPVAVSKAKEYITQSIRKSYRAGRRHWVLA